MVSRPLPMDRTFAEVFDENYGGGLKANAEVKDQIGFEIELEGMHVIQKVADHDLYKFFKLEPDGSLRVLKKGAECTEYVFKKPLDLRQADKAIKTMMDFLTSKGVEVFDSYRTSIHVHVNCCGETHRHLANFLTLAIIFDELFTSQNGKYRIGNNFCLRSRDAEGQVRDLCNSIRAYGNFFNVQGTHRYSSVNIASLTKFGTVEFRSLECTTDYERVIHWVRTLQALKEASRQYKDPREIIAKFSQRGPLGFLISHLGQQYAKYAAVPGYDIMLRDGMRLAQDFAFCSEWLNSADKNVPQPKKLRKTGLFAQYEDVIYGHAPAPLGAHAAQPAQPAGWHNHFNPFINAAAQQPVGVVEVTPDLDDDDDDVPPDWLLDDDDD